jgi:poly(3-hydroxybutyrate) depolymerase
MQIVCAPNIAQEPVNGLQRDVYWRAPHGNAPDAGWPAVIVYQGSFFGPPSTWGTVKSDLAFGGFQQARMQVSLLDQGYVVLAPAAAGVAWQTNMTVSWDLTTDKIVIDKLLADMRAGKFGPIDTTRLYATGISSGGYMTSRMALSYPGVFRALVIQSASWATCGGSLCVLPSSLPADHPPTLFLHGQNDQIVPLSSAQPYVDALRAQHTEVELFVDPNAGHEWLHDSPERISAWFSAH